VVIVKRNRKKQRQQKVLLQGISNEERGLPEICKSLISLEWIQW
jgi:hypothetical protein